MDARGRHQVQLLQLRSRLHLEAVLGADGRPAAFLERSAFTSFFATVFPPPSSDVPANENAIHASAREAFHNGGVYPYGSGIERGQGLEDMPYVIDNVHIENCPAPNHIRCGWMRSVANLYHAFGICSFADEMAISAGRDAKDYLLDLIGPGRRFSEAALHSRGGRELRQQHLPGESPGPVDRRTGKRAHARLSAGHAAAAKRRGACGPGVGLG